MAKNTSSSAFRKIDVDLYNEDNFREEEQIELQSPPVGPDESEVSMLLNQYINIENSSIAPPRTKKSPFRMRGKSSTLTASELLSLREWEDRRNIDALKTVLRSAPLGSKTQQVKDNALNLTMKVLLSIKSSQIEEAVLSLEPDLIDVLMKYIYRGFEMPSEKSSGHLLMWHEKAYAVGGVGSIVRVLTDSKRA